MNYKVYSGHIEFSKDDGIFWRKVLGLPASISISISNFAVFDARAPSSSDSENSKVLGSVDVSA